MTIIEQSVIPKNPQKRSEDGIVVTDDFVAVIDGSTSKSTRRCHHELSLRRHSNGELAMLITANFIKKMKKDTTCRQFCTGVTAAIRRHYVKSLLPHLAQHPEDRLTASAVVFSRLRRELWMVGDCQALITPSHSPSLSLPSHSPLLPSHSPSLPSHYFDNPKPYEKELAEMRANIIMASPQPWDHFLEDDTARQAIIPRMLETMKEQNVSYSVIDGFKIPEHLVRIITLDFQPWEIVLASDGYPFLCATMDESEKKLKEQSIADPLNIGTFKATKAFAKGNNSFDDRAYIRFIPDGR